jgi:F-type H+-transporting ATPase subunit epsilon
VRAGDIDEAAVRAAMEEARRALEHKDPKMSAEEAQAQLAMSLAQLSALERLRKNLKH